MKSAIPFQKILEYHKEVTKRAEEEFFSLRVTSEDSSRWSFIENFSPKNLHGPWTIAESQISSDPLKRAILNGSVSEIFIGGPCYSQKRKDNEYLSPVLYRAIILSPEEDGSFLLEPDQGGWNVSSLVYSYLEMLAIHPEQPLEEFMLAALEKAHDDALKQSGDVTTRLIHEIDLTFPELGKKLQSFRAQNGKSPRSSEWVVFTPATAFSLTRHILSDYSQLEKTLQKDPEAVGGLKLLVQGLDLSEASVNVSPLPFVPLNASQKRAVEGVLKNKPVTVISGPPGCGKSQVVVSIILNAWAQSKTVLFASNNNEAVDVVKERLKPFENSFPIYVRAGNREKNDARDKINRVIGAVVSGAAQRYKSQPEATIRDYKHAKKTLVSLLESKTPQIINQIVVSAVKAYGLYNSTKEELEQKIQTFEDALVSIGYRTNPFLFCDALLTPFEMWVKEINPIKNNLAQNLLIRNDYQKKLALLIDKRASLFISIGGDPDKVERWEWLSETAPIEKQKNWIKKISDFLATDPENKLSPFPWNKEYDFWESEQHAAQWGNGAKIASEKILQLLSQEKQQLKEIYDLEKEKESAQEALEKLGLSVRDDFSEETVREWLQTYAFMNTLPNRFFDWTPFSAKKGSQRQLNMIEKELHRLLPIAVWNDVGQLDLEGRNRLYQKLIPIEKWSSLKRKWDGYASFRNSYNQKFDEVRLTLKELSFYDFPDDINMKHWEEIAALLSKQAALSEKASESHRKKFEYEETQKAFDEIGKSFQLLNRGIPVREIWVKDKGKLWKEVTEKSPANAGFEIASELRKLLYEGTMDVFIANWEDMIKIHADIDQYNHLINKIPSDSSIIEQWWGKSPKGLSVTNLDLSVLPESDSPLFAHLDLCKKWSSQWQAFLENENKELNSRLKSEKERAFELLREAIEKFPEVECKKAFISVTQPLLNQKEEYWPLQELMKSIEELNPDRLAAQINEIDAKLTAAEFQSALSKRVHELSSDKETLLALSKLKDHYERCGDQIDSSAYPEFRAALKALPIWITTALSPQALPILPELFDLLIIDEATQCTLTPLLPLIYRAKTVTVIGDPEQLPAIDIIPKEAERALATKLGIIEWMSSYGHAGKSVYTCFLDKLPGRHFDVLYLDEHYRSHPLIIGFSNQHIYQQRLKLKKAYGQSGLNPYANGVYGMDVSGQCQRGKGYSSWINEPEALEVSKIIVGLSNNGQRHSFSVGVISPFKAQVTLIEEMLEKHAASEGVKVGTVHKYQGGEQDLIFFSPVVSAGMPGATARWVENPPNLINVAVTRAKDGFFFVGDFKVCRKQAGILGKLTQYVETIMTLRKTSVAELDLFGRMVLCGWSPEIHCQISDIEVDFVLRNASQGTKLVIEVDGQQHKKAKVQDASRDAFLRAQGYNVLRFTTRDILEVPDRVIEDIRSAYEPSPKKEDKVWDIS